MATITISGNPGATFPDMNVYPLSSTTSDPQSDSNYVLLNSCSWGVGEGYLLAPSLSAIQGGSTITSASLSLNVCSVLSDGDLTITIDMTRSLRAVVNPSWLGAQNHFDGSWQVDVPWTIPGGLSAASDRAPVPSASGSTRKQIGSQLVDGYIDLTGMQLVADIQAIVDGGPNLGWFVNRRDHHALDQRLTILHGTAATPNTTWQSSGPGAIPLSQIGAPGRRPILTVTYAP